MYLLPEDVFGVQSAGKIFEQMVSYSFSYISWYINSLGVGAGQATRLGGCLRIPDCWQQFRADGELFSNYISWCIYIYAIRGRLRSADRRKQL